MLQLFDRALGESMSARKTHPLSTIQLYNVRLLHDDYPAGLDDIYGAGDRRGYTSVGFRALAHLNSTQLEAVRKCKGLERFAVDSGRQDERTVEVIATVRTWHFMEADEDDEDEDKDNEEDALRKGLVLETTTRRHYKVLQDGPKGENGLEEATSAKSMQSLERYRLLALLRHMRKNIEVKGHQTLEWVVQQRLANPKCVFPAPFLDPLEANQVEQKLREHGDFLRGYLADRTGDVHVDLKYYICGPQAFTKKFMEGKSSVVQKAKVIVMAAPLQANHTPGRTKGSKPRSVPLTPSKTPSSASKNSVRDSPIVRPRASRTEVGGPSRSKKTPPPPASPSPARVHEVIELWSDDEDVDMDFDARGRAESLPSPPPDIEEEEEEEEEETLEVEVRTEPQVVPLGIGELPAGYVWNWTYAQFEWENVPRELRTAPSMDLTPWCWRCPLENRCPVEMNFRRPNKWLKKVVLDTAEQRAVVREAIDNDNMRDRAFEKLFRVIVSAHYKMHLRKPN